VCYPEAEPSLHAVRRRYNVILNWRAVSATKKVEARRLFLALWLVDSAASSKANDLERLGGANAVQVAADAGHRRWPVSLDSEP